VNHRLLRALSPERVAGASTSFTPGRLRGICWRSAVACTTSLQCGKPRGKLTGRRWRPPAVL